MTRELWEQLSNLDNLEVGTTETREPAMHAIFAL